MHCPRCGFEQPQSEECIGCGIIFSKYVESLGRGDTTEGETTTPAPAQPATDPFAPPAAAPAQSATDPFAPPAPSPVAAPTPDPFAETGARVAIQDPFAVPTQPAQVASAGAPGMQGSETPTVVPGTANPTQHGAQNQTGSWGAEAAFQDTQESGHLKGNVHDMGTVPTPAYEVAGSSPTRSPPNPRARQQAPG